MPTYNNHPYSSIRNLNLKDGLLRFAKTYSSNPFSTTEDGLYVDSNYHIVYSAQGQKHVFTVTSPSVSPSRSPSLSPSS